MEYKSCIKCLEIKSLTEFYRDKYQIDGRVSVCKKCRKSYYNKHYLKNKENYLQKTKEYREKNKERYKLYNTDYVLKKRFGISLIEYNLMLNSQNNVCDICKQKQKGRYRMAVDHCHKTNKIRGLLCSYCNRAIGLLKDDINLLKSAINYLEKNG